MALTDSDRSRVMRLILQVARDGAAQAHLKTLLTEANATIAGHRQDLRMAKAQVAQRDMRIALNRSGAR